MAINTHFTILFFRLGLLDFKHVCGAKLHTSNVQRSIRTTINNFYLFCLVVNIFFQHYFCILYRISALTVFSNNKQFLINQDKENIFLNITTCFCNAEYAELGLEDFNNFLKIREEQYLTFL